MIIAAVFAAFAVFLGVWVLGKAFTPEGKIGKKKIISKRIFEGPSNTIRPEFTGLVRQDRLSDIHSLQQFLEKQSFIPQLALWMKRSGIKISLTVFLLIFVSTGSLVFMIARFFMPFPAALGLAGACFYLPFVVLKRENTNYIAKFSEHLPDASSIISNNLKVGHSIETALEGVSKNAPYPVSAEFKTICGEVKLGLPLETALKNLYERITTPEVKIFIVGITIQQELGGNLSEIMDNLESTIRERHALHREVKVLSTQGVLSMWVLFLMPFGFGMVWVLTNPALLTDFVQSSFGMKLMFISFCIQMFAFFIMKRVVTIQN